MTARQIRVNNLVYEFSGASSGIGAATAFQMAIEGAHLIITGRNEKNLEQVAEKCYEDCWNRPKMVFGMLIQNVQENPF